MFLMMVGLVAFLAIGRSRAYNEVLIEEGPRFSKIVVITLLGDIDDAQSQSIYDQLKETRGDKTVKGVILRISSPGGTISGSDGIYQQLRKYRSETGKPVVAFMQGIAASGAYYASVGCDKIVAEPTVLTGSIGVVMRYLVFQELLESKLGIRAIVQTEGQKKDWPSSFRQPKDEEIQYLREKVILPAYERFIEVVAEGRQASLTKNEVRGLADGGIFGAREAADKKLIDQIGYLDDAIKLSKSLAGIEDARVVEYHRVFSLSSLLSAKSNDALNLGLNVLQQFRTPQVLYLWSSY
jgi:protease-4